MGPYSNPGGLGRPPRTSLSFLPIPPIPPRSRRGELVEPWRDQNVPGSREEEAVRRDNPRGAKLHGANLVAVPIEHVRERRRDEHDPHASRAVDRGGPNR